MERTQHWRELLAKQSPQHPQLYFSLFIRSLLLLCCLANGWKQGINHHEFESWRKWQIILRNSEDLSIFCVSSKPRFSISVQQWIIWKRCFYKLILKQNSEFFPPELHQRKITDLLISYFFKNILWKVKFFSLIENETTGAFFLKIKTFLNHLNEVLLIN